MTLSNTIYHTCIDVLNFVLINVETYIYLGKKSLLYTIFIYITAEFGHNDDRKGKGWLLKNQSRNGLTVYLYVFQIIINKSKEFSSSGIYKRFFNFIQFLEQNIFANLSMII